ncbi:BTB/POZ protein [Dichotomocladium elegans]|nr:BTB/POZ protein [Dichotomocladium elegans]
MYIYGGKDEHGNTVSDLYMINANAAPYTPHLVLSGYQSNASTHMVLLKSQHFCEAVCGKLLVFGRYLSHHHHQTNPEAAAYGLWMLDLDTLEWQRQGCSANFDVGGWNYFTVISESMVPTNDDPKVVVNNLFFLGNTDPFRPQGYDHFRDAWVINAETLGLYDIPPPHFSHEFAQLLNNPELSDFVIVPSSGPELHVHQVILITRWPHFRNIYRSGMIEAQERRMEILEPYETVLALIKYLYSDRLDDDVSWQVVCQVLVVANMYCLNRLKKLCCERLYRQHMSVESCGLIFEKAILAEEAGLKMLALDFMFRNYGSILKSDVLLNMPAAVRQAFMEQVPDEASLQVIRRSCRLCPPPSLYSQSSLAGAVPNEKSPS